VRCAKVQAKKSPVMNRALKGSLKRGFREDPRRQLVHCGGCPQRVVELSGYSLNAA
jgi:hypothetical protein